jgi:hypothetical protein
MGLFEKASDAEANEAEFVRLSALPLDDLAAEVMAHVPTIELGAVGTGPTARELAKAMAPSRLKRESQLPMILIVREGLQVLEHAGLVCVDIRPETTPEPEYSLTRAGQAAIDSGDIISNLRRR